MKIIEYLALKYGKRGHGCGFILALEARAFGIPFPLAAGWLDEHADREIDDEARARLVASLRTCVITRHEGKKTASARDGLRALGEPIPESAFQIPLREDVPA